MTTPAIVPAIALPLLRLSDTERDAAAALRRRLQSVMYTNQAKSALYEAKRTAEDLGISAPTGLPELVQAVMGWPGTVVDVLEERLEHRGWSGADGLDLDLVFSDNHLGVEAGRGHLDALIYGCGFITVGRGDVDAGEPEVLVSVESTESCTVEWDYRLRRAKSALSQTRDEYGIVVLETLYLPDETIIFERVRGELVVVDRDHHGLGRVPVARMLNRDRASDVNGRSEITRAVTYYTDAAVRTLLGMEINREFYTSPKWTVLNADPEVFGLDPEKSREENKQAGWSATQGRMNVVPPQEDTNGERIEPKLHEFRPAPPTPYIEQIKAYSQLLAAESGIPAPYLGFVTDNPSSADSIRQQEYRLVKRAERRQTSFGLAWLEVAYLSLLMRDGGVDRDEFRQVSVNWRDAATPTRAAAADEAAKLIGSGVLPADSSVTWDRIGLTTQEQMQLERDRRRRSVNDLIGRITPTASGASPADPGVEE
ncbi:phage portal protein [Gordonia alkanivorans]|uniref:phage portal protein n=1 Tax=Gordonia alkanivorans TaxID=84096 RepID=UPI0024B7EE7A|nr:phage portal protein [Gordonia alkanivorans]MDJ0010107.1 phage portal protein [Gordonia alkanivorans]MDJ0495703.1 phage portal protein [Gordonia alkanivorans]